MSECDNGQVDKHEKEKKKEDEEKLPKSITVTIACAIIAIYITVMPVLLIWYLAYEYIKQFE